ncbi:MAG: hypothetical protein CFK52_03150 [Chloracidobacterium sp. CP2_5A]|nr:MAG: hypothetical protein CFK52_03150 [Chloracidobacterium sp. CP2_5A]
MDFPLRLVSPCRLRFVAWMTLWLVAWGALGSHPAQPSRAWDERPALSPVKPWPSEIGARFVQDYGQDAFHSLPQTWSAIQDEQGVLYVANDAGLLAYDGARWQLIALPNRATARSLAVGADGRVYLGAENDFGYLAGAPDGAAQLVSLVERLPPDKRRFGSVWRSWATPAGIFFQTYRYLFHLVGDAIHIHEPDGRVARDDFVWSHWVNGTLYVHQRHVGLLKLGGDETLRLASGGAQFAERRVCALLPFDETRLLAVTRDSGLWLYAPETGVAETLPLAPQLAKAPDINHACWLADGRLAIATDLFGVILCDRQGRVLEVIGRRDGLGSPSVHWVYSDRQGGLWAAHRNGVAHIEACAPLSYFDEARGLEGRVFALHRHAGRLYAGTLAGLFELTNEESAPPVVGQARFRRVPGIESDCWHMATDGSDMLVATGDGVYAVTPRSDAAPQIRKLDIDDRAYTLHADPTQLGRLYVGGRNGLIRLTRRGADWKVEAPVFGVRDEIRSIVVTTEGLWCGTMYQGAWLIPIASLRRAPPSDATQAIRIDESVGLPTQRETFVARVDDQALLATQRGAYVFDPRQRALTPAEKLPMFREAPVFRLSQDAAGNVWYSQDFDRRGVLRPGDNHQLWADTRALRLPPACLLRAIFCEPDGVVWLGGDKGLFRYDANAPPIDRGAGQALIRRVTAGDGQTLLGGFGPAPPAARVIPYAANRLRCEAALTSFPRESQHRFRFKLDGADREWSAWAAEPVKEYTNLLEGDYTLRVEAEDLYGRVSAAAPVRIRVLPPWYRTWWAYALAVLLAGGGALGGVRLRERALVQRTLALERIVAERTAEIALQRDEILDSIRYAERIQKSILPSPEVLQRRLPEHFILYAPRDIVSGDFYWAQPAGAATLLVVADCTGHGVPGAFMSLISNDLLNQIVIGRGIHDPARILDELHAGIVTALSQGQGGADRVEDGLDAGVLWLDAAGRRARYAGARRPLYHARRGTLTEIKGDLASVGGTRRREHRYAEHALALESGDMLYLTTDGFADQVDRDGKKYGARRLKAFLSEIAEQPLSEQAAALRAQVGAGRLRDDVTIVSVRLPSG